MTGMRRASSYRRRSGAQPWSAEIRNPARQGSSFPKPGVPRRLRRAASPEPAARVALAGLVAPLVLAARVVPLLELGLERAARRARVTLELAARGALPPERGPA